MSCHTQDDDKYTGKEVPYDSEHARLLFDDDKRNQRACDVDSSLKKVPLQ